MGALLGDVNPPALKLTQLKTRCRYANRFENAFDIAFSPQLEVSLPCGPALAAVFERLLRAWHAVPIVEDLSNSAAIYDLPTQATALLSIPRLVMTLHLDSSGTAGQRRDEAASCLVFDLLGVGYRREWSPPCGFGGKDGATPTTSKVRQLIELQSVAIYDLTRNAATMPEEAPYPLLPRPGMAEPAGELDGVPDGLCMLLLEGMCADLTKHIDATNVAPRPYGAPPPHAWPRIATVLSKQMDVTIGGMQMVREQP